MIAAKAAAHAVRPKGSSREGFTYVDSGMSRYFLDV